MKMPDNYQAEADMRTMMEAHKIRSAAMYYC